jgi:hypothetical protein
MPGAGLEPATPPKGQRVLSARTLPVCLPGRDDRSFGCRSESATKMRGVRRSVPPNHDELLPSADLASYAYLLGLYLGDGHISAHHRGVFQLTISMDSRYPAIADEARQAIEAVLPNNRANVAKRAGYNVTLITCSSKTLPTLFPQHGSGRKHNRPIWLAPWQRSITFVHAEELIRGLIHSDGSRFIATQRSKHQAYRYPRYCFKNRSSGIMAIFCEHLDLVGVNWTLTRSDQAQVARADSVAILDTVVGPKA